jgi:hypothetical protein
MKDKERTARKYVLIFTAVAISLLMISSATAVNIRQLNKTDGILKTSEDDEVYIDPEFYLEGDAQKKLLEDALDEIDDSDIQLILNEMIKEMNNKEYVDNTDVEDMVDTLSLTGVFPDMYSSKYIDGGLFEGPLGGYLERIFLFNIRWKGGFHSPLNSKTVIKELKFPFTTTATYRGKQSGSCIGFSGSALDGALATPYDYYFEGTGLVIFIKGTASSTTAKSKPSAHPAAIRVLDLLAPNVASMLRHVLLRL